MLPYQATVTDRAIINIKTMHSDLFKAVKYTVIRVIGQSGYA